MERRPRPIRRGRAMSAVRRARLPACGPFRSGGGAPRLRTVSGPAGRVRSTVRGTDFPRWPGVGRRPPRGGRPAPPSRWTADRPVVARGAAHGPSGAGGRAPAARPLAAGPRRPLPADTPAPAPPRPRPRPRPVTWPQRTARPTGPTDERADLGRSGPVRAAGGPAFRRRRPVAPRAYPPPWRPRRRRCRGIPPAGAAGPAASSRLRLPRPVPRRTRGPACSAPAVRPEAPAPPGYGHPAYPGVTGLARPAGAPENGMGIAAMVLGICPARCSAGRGDPPRVHGRPRHRLRDPGPRAGPPGRGHQPRAGPGRDHLGIVGTCSASP